MRPAFAPQQVRNTPMTPAKHLEHVVPVAVAPNRPTKFARLELKCHIANSGNTVGISVDEDEFQKDLDDVRDCSHVTLVLNSNGGHVHASFNVTAAIADHPAKITGRVSGSACSGASVILMGCPHREIVQGSGIMVHDCYTVNATALDNYFNDLRSDEIAAVYASDTIRSAVWWRYQMIHESHFDDSESYQFRLVHDIVAPWPGEKEPNHNFAGRNRPVDVSDAEAERVVAAHKAKLHAAAFGKPIKAKNRGERIRQWLADNNLTVADVNKSLRQASQTYTQRALNRRIAEIRAISPVLNRAGLPQRDRNLVATIHHVQAHSHLMANDARYARLTVASN